MKKKKKKHYQVNIKDSCKNKKKLNLNSQDKITYYADDTVIFINETWWVQSVT